METLLDKSPLDHYISNLSDESLNGEFDAVYKNAPLPKSAYCGIGSIRGKFLQKWVSKFYKPVCNSVINIANLSDSQTKSVSFLCLELLGWFLHRHMLITMERSPRWKNDSKYHRKTWVSYQRATTLQASWFPHSSLITAVEVTCHAFHHDFDKVTEIDVHRSQAKVDGAGNRYHRYLLPNECDATFPLRTRRRCFGFDYWTRWGQRWRSNQSSTGDQQQEASLSAER